MKGESKDTKLCSNKKMKNFNIKEHLFNYGLMQEREIEPGLSYGSTSKTFKNEELRKKYSAVLERVSVINLAFTALHLLTKYECLSAHMSGDKLFAEYEDVFGEEELKRVLINKEGTKLHFSFEGSASNLDCVLALSLYLCVFDEAVREKALEYINTQEAKDAFLFCDTLYYRLVHESTWKESTISYDEELIVETAAQMLDFSEPAFPCNMPEVSIKKVKEKDSKTDSLEVTFKDIKEGKFTIDFKWDDEVKENIPSLSSLNSFVPTQSFIELVSKVKYRFDKTLEKMKKGVKDIEILGKDFVNAFLLGKPGTGKTRTIFAVAAALQVPVYSVALSKNTEEDVFQGMNKIVDGELKFIPTDTVKAFKHGGLVVFEEINLADPAVTMGCLGQAIEFPYNIMENGFEPVQRHPLLAVFGTMNIGTYGSKGINQALSSRFKQSFILNETPREEMINILKMSLSSQGQITKPEEKEFTVGKPVKVDDGLVTWVYSAYENMSRYLKETDNEEYMLNLSTRACIGVLESIEEGIPPLQALRIGFVGKIAESDLDLAEDLFDKLKYQTKVPVLQY